jgi:hypothetical protein
MCSGKMIGSLGFSRRGVFIGEGASSGVDRGVVTHRGHGPAPGRAALLCGALVAPLHLLFGSLEASVKFWATDFCFVQFREYFLCNFSETQKYQKTGNWHYGDLLIGYFWKMHKSTMKCNETLSKWCKNKHGASKIIDTFEMYQSPIKPCKFTSCHIWFSKDMNKLNFDELPQEMVIVIKIAVVLPWLKTELFLVPTTSRLTYSIMVLLHSKDLANTNSFFRANFR